MLVIAVATSGDMNQAASAGGASFIVERPLLPKRIRDLVRAAYGRMLRDGQTYFRMAVELPVSIRRVSGTILQCTTLNLSQRGMAITSSTPLGVPAGEQINIGFAIPNTDIFVSAKGKVIWDDKHGKTGITFECTCPSVEARFFNWLHDHFLMTLDTDVAKSDTTQQIS